MPEFVSLVVTDGALVALHQGAPELHTCTVSENQAMCLCVCMYYAVLGKFLKN